MTTRVKSILIRVTEAEDAALERAAKSAGLPKSTWVRVVALREAAKSSAVKKGVFD